MSYRTEDERELFIGLVEWLADRGWLTEPHAKRMWLVGEYMKERSEEQAWGKVRETGE